MFKIPYTYSDSNMDYLTVPAIRTFCKKHNLETNGSRPELIKIIEKFGDTPENKKIVLEWMDDILKEGIKVCLINKITNLSDESLEEMKKKIKSYFQIIPQKNICEALATDKIELVKVKYKYKIIENKKICTKITFIFLTRILHADGSYSPTGQIRLYPMFVEVLCQEGFIVSRAKSLSGIFVVTKSGADEVLINKEDSTSTHKLLCSCLKEVSKALGIEYENSGIQKQAIKKTIFKILEEYTQTPEEIQNKINMSNCQCEEFVKKLFNHIDVELTGENRKDALYDMQIFVEKYSSITHSDTGIFIRDREAYPVKFVAHDNELTKIEETSSGYEDPLQSKKAFFDSKKTVYSDKKCDKICLCCKSKSKMYFQKKPFNVVVGIRGSECEVKFMRYVEEEDIEHVLSGIIQKYDL